MFKNIKYFGALLRKAMLTLFPEHSEAEKQADILGQRLNYLAEQVLLNTISSTERATIQSTLTTYKRLCKSIGVRYSMYCDISSIELLNGKVNKNTKEFAVDKTLFGYPQCG